MFVDHTGTVLHCVLQVWSYYIGAPTTALTLKVIIDKSCGEVSLLEQDTIENVS